MTAGLSKKERICSVKAVEELLSHGRYVSRGPLRCCWHRRSGEEFQTNRIMVAVPKKLFKRAVKRNLLKRRIREAYRLQKGLLPQACLDLMFVYSNKEIADFKDIEYAVNQSIVFISEKVATSQAAGSALEDGQQ